MTLPPKTRLGTYEILGPLGAGGMGEVYRAKDLRLGREIAIKVLPSEVASHPDRLAHLEREARTIAGLNHPNIVILHSIEEYEGIRFLTMELVEGQTLSSMITTGGLPLARILEIAIPLADALVAAHQRGVVHRDLKPANVMMTREGRVKILDFGLAKTLDAAGFDSLTATAGPSRTGAGTLPYMAPEQIRSEPVDSRADLFSLGIILYELATGRRPFRGKTSADLSTSILRDEPETLGSLRPDLPDDFGRVVRLCLEKDRRDRIQTTQDVLNELRRLKRGGARDAASASRPQKAVSVAVLPFINRSGSAEDEYFSDGLADELLSVLSKIKALRVAARTSSFYFKGKDVPISEIGKALNVSAIVEGSVRKAGTRVRISVQLLQASDGYLLWSETYDRTLDDIFALQDDIAGSVVKELRTTLLGVEADSAASGEARADVAKAARGRGADPEAHRLYLLARHLIERMTQEDIAKGIGYLNQALDKNPDFALAWTQLSRAHAAMVAQGWSAPEEGYRRARETVERALLLEPELPEAHAQLGWIRTAHWDWRGARASFERALELEPGNVLALRWAGGLEQYLGDVDRALALHRRAVDRDPMCAPAYNNFGLALHVADRLAEAEEAYRKALDLAPQRAITRANLALVLLALGRKDEALEQANAEPAEWARLFAQAIVLHSCGRRQESDKALEELIDKHAEDSPKQVAEVNAVRGDVEAAFHWLERAYAMRDGGLCEMKTSPQLRTLHGDPRWTAFLKKMGLEDQRAATVALDS